MQKDSYPLAPHSLLAGDKQGMPHGSSVAAIVRSLLDSAVDDLAAAFGLAADLGRIAPVGIPTLVRGTIELSGVGMWIITGEERKGRQERALQVAHDSLVNVGKYWERVSETPFAPTEVRSEANKVVQDFAADRESLLAGAAKLGLDKKHVSARLNRTNTLQQIDKARDTQFFSWWQLCSGFAHGQAWAPQLFNKFLYTHEMIDGGVLTGRTLDLDGALTMLQRGQYAVQELLGSFELGRMPAPNLGPQTTIVARPQPLTP